MKKRFLFIMGCLFAFTMHSQSISPNILNSAGGSANINNIRYDWSFGEMLAINTVSSSKLTVTQGVLQTRTDTAGTGIRDMDVSIPSITVFPNPTQNSVHVEWDYPIAGTLQYRLTDIQGKLIQEKQLNVQKGVDQQTLDLSGLPGGTYLLVFTVKQGPHTYSQTSRIQKNNE